MAYSSSCRRRVLLSLCLRSSLRLHHLHRPSPRVSFHFPPRPQHVLLVFPSSPPQHATPNQKPTTLLGAFPSPPSPFRTRLPPVQRERERERSRQRRRAVNNPTRPAGSHISELFTLLNKGDFSRARAPNIAEAGRKKKKEKKGTRRHNRLSPSCLLLVCCLLLTGIFGP